MRSLAKLPEIKTGVLYPSCFLEESVDNVKQTSAQLYLDQIKHLSNEIQDYIECLNFKGYDVKGVSFETITATKTEILK